MFVTGCHRSGTSLVASLLGDLLGHSSAASPLLSAQPDNPQGFFESRQLVDLNNELIGWLGRDWSTPPLLAPCWDQPPFLSRLEARRNQFKHWSLNSDWVDKDPRLCITYPAYLHLLLKRVPLVCVLRHPLEVATSLYARNGMPVNLGLSLWFLYNHHLSAAVESSDCMLTYHDVLTANKDEASALLLARIAPMMDLIGVQLPSDDQWNKFLLNRLRPDLNRSQASLPQAVRIAINPALLHCCERAYAAVVSSGLDFAESFYDAFEAVPRGLLLLLAREGRWCEIDQSPQKKESQRIVSTELQDFDHVNMDWKQQAIHSEQALKDLQDELRLLKSSSSWKITSPMRAIADYLRGSQ